MGLRFAATSPSDMPQVRDFLLKTFAADPALNSFRPEVLHWKYFSPHADWNGSRSYVLRNGDDIVAHGSVWPVRFLRGGTEIKAIHLIDWAASRGSPGSGIQMLRKIAEMGDILITIGGSADTKAILPKLGYKHGGELKRYVYVARPWKQMRTSPEHNWKTPLRFIRNTASSLKRFPAPAAGWEVVKVLRFESSLERILEHQSSTPDLRAVRTVAGLNYMLDCPGAEFSGYVVSHNKNCHGYFVLSKVGRQSRIVDIEAGSDPHDRSTVCSIAAFTACRDPEVCEVVVGTSRPEVGETFKQIGFWERRVDSVLYYDPKKRMNPGVQFELSLLDSDVSFFYDPQYPYIS